MTPKEEILQKHCDKYSTFLHLQEGNNIIDGSADSAFEAMDDYAKQQSIEFVEWKDKYFKTTYPIDRKMYTLKYYSHVEETNSTFGTHYNLPELYEIFSKIQHNQLNINY